MMLYEKERGFFRGEELEELIEIIDFFNSISEEWA